MTAQRRFATLALFPLLAHVLHLSFGHLLAIGSVRPSLDLIVLLTACAFASPNEGAVLGLFVGLMDAAAVPIDVGTTLFSHTLAGFLVGWLELRVFRESPVVALLIVFFGTLFTYLCVMLFAPPPNLAHWALRSLLEAVYNALLAVPCYLVMRRAVRGPAQTVGRRLR